MIEIDSDQVRRYVAELGAYGQHGDTGVWRVVFSPEWQQAQDQIARWCQDAGLQTRRDAVGNVWGTLRGTEDGPSIVSGSHIDSQTPGGQYDGALGVIGALVAIGQLRRQFGPPRKTLEVVSLCEEEASRFHEANFWGSRAITGQVTAEHLTSIRDADGVSIGEAMAQVGLDPARFREARRTDIDTFVELHIEQGPILEDADLSVGIVRAISGIRHYVVEVRGRADHAGARPMASRRDPMPAVADIVRGALHNALDLGAPAVTTVGRMTVAPNIPAAVPETVEFTIDARHPDVDQQEELFRRQEQLVRSVAEAHGLEVSVKVVLDLPPSPCDPETVKTLQDAAASEGVEALLMHSGAVHDTQRMATIAKTAMVFVRSKDGRSHTPEEFSSVEDAVDGIRVLAEGLRRLAY